MVLLYCLITDGNSDNEKAFPAKNTGLFNKLPKLRAIEEPLSVCLE